MKDGEANNQMKEELRGLRLRIAELEKTAAERIAVERDLKAAQEEYRLHFDNANDVIYTLDLRLRIVEVSPSIERILGYQPREVMRKSIRTIQLLSPKSVARAVSDSLKVLTGKRIEAAVYEFIAKDGTRRIGEVSGAPARRNGRIVGLVSVARDVTERVAAQDALREKEELLSGILDSINEGILVLDSKYRYSYWNREMERISKTVSSQVVGRSEKAWEIFPHLKKEGVDKMIRRAMRGETVSGERIPFRLLDDSRGYTSETFMPLRKSDGSVGGVLGVVRNVTQQMKNENRLKKSLQEKEVLLREIHHRVKNNMQIMTSLLRLQARNVEDPGVRKMFDESRNRIHSMALIHEKLYQTSDFTNIHYAEYVKSLVVHLFSTYNVDRKNVGLKLDLEDVLLDINTAIPCGLLINELVSNSLKHAFPEDRRGEVRVGLHAVGADRVRLVVADNGVGIPDERTWKNPSSLGMRIIQDLIRQIEAKVRFEGGNGTSCTLTFAVRKSS